MKFALAKVWLRRLNIRILTHLSLMIGTWAVAYAYFSYHFLQLGGHWTVVIALFLACCVRAFSLEYYHSRNAIQNSELVELSEPNRQRLVRIVENVCNTRMIKNTTKLWQIRKPVGRLKCNAAMVDKLLWGEDYLLIDQQVLDILTDEELEGLVAHELRHMDSKLNKFERLVMALRDSNIVAVFVLGVCFLNTFYGHILVEFWSIYFTLLGGGSLFGLAYAVSMYCEKPFMRLLELRTDAMAAVDLGSVLGLVKAMEKLSTATPSMIAAEKIDIDSPKYRDKTHPTMVERARALVALQGHGCNPRERRVGKIAQSIATRMGNKFIHRFRFV